MIYIDVSSSYIDKIINKSKYDKNNFNKIKENIVKDINILKSLKPDIFIDNYVIKYNKYKILQAKNIFEIIVYLELCGIQRDIDYTFDWKFFLKNN